MWKDIRWKARKLSGSRPYSPVLIGPVGGIGIGSRGKEWLGRFRNGNGRRSAILTSGKGRFERGYNLWYVMAIELLNCGIEFCFLHTFYEKFCNFAHRIRSFGPTSLRFSGPVCKGRKAYWGELALVLFEGGFSFGVPYLSLVVRKILPGEVWFVSTSVETC